jgi:hypothetical protein
MDMILKNMMEEFKVKKETELLKAKSEGKQTRYYMSGQKPVLIEMSADKCKKLCEKAGIEYLSGYEHRIFDGVTSTETVDRYGDIVRFNGAQFVNYLKNPVVMLSHAHDQFPIGNSVQISKDTTVKGIRSYDLYVDDRVDSSGRADLAFKFRKSGMMPGISIGFMVISAKADHTAEEKNKLGLGKWGIEILEFDYLEHSQVSIPANPEALSKMLKSMDSGLLHSVFCKDDLSLLEATDLLPGDLIDIFEKYTIKSDVTIIDLNINPSVEEPVFRPYPNEHACRLNDPDKYEKMRRGKRKHDGKEYSVIYGKLTDSDKWEEQAYRYAKDVWETTDARKHCKSHGGTFEAAKGDKAVLEDGTILTHDGDGDWQEIEPITNQIESNTDITKKLDEMVSAIESLPEKIASSLASKPNNNPDEDELYTENLLSDFELKPKF